MGITDAKFIDDAGVTRFEGEIAGLVAADTINGVAINNSPSGAGESLVTVDPANAQWQAGGGGFAIGSSFLIAASIDQAGLTSGVATAGSFTVASFAGADIAIDGMDPTKINIATTGWYAVSLLLPLEAGGGGFTGVVANINVNGARLGDSDWIHSDSLSAAPNFYWPLVAPALPLTAADVLTFTAVGTTTAGNWEWDPSSLALRVTRLS